MKIEAAFSPTGVGQVLAGPCYVRGHSVAETLGCRSRETQHRDPAAGAGRHSTWGLRLKHLNLYHPKQLCFSACLSAPDWPSYIISYRSCSGTSPPGFQAQVVGPAWKSSSQNKTKGDQKDSNSTETSEWFTLFLLTLILVQELLLM